VHLACRYGARRLCVPLDPAVPALLCFLPTRLPADEARQPLKLELPEGNLIGLAKERLPVVVSFASGRPLSFTALVEFLDEVGRTDEGFQRDVLVVHPHTKLQSGTKGEAWRLQPQLGVESGVGKERQRRFCRVQCRMRPSVARTAPGLTFVPWYLPQTPFRGPRAAVGALLCADRHRHHRQLPSDNTAVLRGDAG
jgi:hypothetical protein